MTPDPKDLLSHADFVRELARRLVFDEHLSADLTQETWLAALEHPPPSGDSLGSWFSQVLRNFARKLFRSELRRRHRERTAARPDRAPSTEEIAAREEIRCRVVQAVKDLKEPYRSVILLRYYDDLPPRDIAKVLNIPRETVKTRLHRGLELLRTRLDALHGGERKAWCLALAPIAGLDLTASSAGASTGGAAVLTGGLAMTAKVKVGAAAALLLCSVLALWNLFTTGEKEGPGRSADQGQHNVEADRAQEMKEGVDAAEGSDETAGIEERQHLSPTARLSGTVQNKVTSEPLPRGTAILTMGSSGKQRKVLFDDTGRFDIQGIDKPGPAWLVLKAPAYWERVIELDHVGETIIDLGTLYLEPEWAVRGKVEGPDGQSFPGADVVGYWFKVTLVDGAFQSHLVEQETTSGPDGSFILCPKKVDGDLDFPPEYLHASAKGFTSSWLRVSKGGHHLLELETDRSLRGRVTWSSDDTPVAGALVRCLKEDDPNLKIMNTTRTGPDGSFLLSRLPGSALEVGIYLRSPTDPKQKSDRSIFARRGVSDLGAVRIEGPCAFRVRVLDESSQQPVEGVRVGYGDSGYTMGSSESDAGGFALITGLPAWTEFFMMYKIEGESRLNRHQRGKGPRRIAMTGEAGSTTQVHLAVTREPPQEATPVAPTILIKGIVKDPEGNPVSRVRVSFQVGGTPYPTATTPEERVALNREIFFGSPYGRGYRADLTADGEGRFQGRKRFVPGIHVLEGVALQHPDFLPCWIPGENLEGGSLDELAFCMEPIAEWIRGEVVDPSGRPMARARVRSRYLMEAGKGDPVTHARLTDEGGAFHIPLLPDLNLCCRASAEGYAESRVEGKVEGFRSGIRIVLHLEEEPVRYPISLRCRSSRGRPLRGLTVTAYACDGDSFMVGVNMGKEWYRVVTDGQGRATVETDSSASSVTVAWSLKQGSHFIPRGSGLFVPTGFLVYEGWRSLEPGPLEHTITIPAGQVFEILLVFHGISKAIEDCIDLLPDGTTLELVPEGKGDSIVLTEPLAEEEQWRWHVSHEELRWGAKNNRALAVRRFVPEGRYRLSARFPGYLPYLSDDLDLTDTDKIHAMIVDLNLGN